MIKISKTIYRVIYYYLKTNLNCSLFQEKNHNLSSIFVYNSFEFFLKLKKNYKPSFNFIEDILISKCIKFFN